MTTDSALTEDSFSYFIQSLTPKTHTQAAEFIRDHPFYDGRAVRIAIWDTGVDPAAEGLQMTSDGRPKLIHMRDTSGSGDVEMQITMIIGEKESRLLNSLTNRQLKIPESWTIRDGLVRIGSKLSSDLFPSAIMTRLSKDYKDNIWLKEYNRIYSEVSEKKQRIKEMSCMNHMEPTIQLECLEMLEKVYEYPTPILDCLVFHDETDWVACVDTSSLNPTMQLEDMTLLSSYDKNRQFGNFGGKTNLNYGINIHDDGKLLEIVACSGSHGTHVASIAAGFFSSNIDCNGIAPGAEIVSIKISDTRLGSMETGMALAFAAQVTVDLKCDIVNLSFGEATIQPNCGRVCKVMKELVTKHGIVFCSSSGNNGPAFSTVGSPGGTTDTLFGISPMVFPDMIESNYSLPVDKTVELVPLVYTWASRGPTTDGSLGIHVAAPGAAITSVGTWQNRSIGLMNGSSMSSPNACGGISLLISAAKQLNKSISPWLLSLATLNSAKTVSNVSRLSQGYGLLQVKSAFSYLQKYWMLVSQNCKKDDEKLKIESCVMEPVSEKINDTQTMLSQRILSKSEFSLCNRISQFNSKCQTPLHLFRIKCTLSSGNRGIFLREPFETMQLRQFTVNVQPDFDQETVCLNEQLNLKMYLHVVCKASWVNCPRFFTLYNQERSIIIKVDPTKLTRDYPEFDSTESCGDSDYGVYFTEIEFHCLEFSHLGPLARLPITIFKPEPIPLLRWSSRAHFGPLRKTVRHFIATPDGADSLLFYVQPITVMEGSGRFDLRIMQIQPNVSTLSSELSKSLVLDKKVSMSLSEPIGYMLSGSTSSTIEITLAQYWSATSDAELEYAIDFHGLRSSIDNIKMLSSDNHYRLVIESQLQTEEISPSISINCLVHPIRPYREEISYIRKSVPSDKELICLDLYYTFTNVKPGEVGIFCPALGNLLYENDFYSQIYHIYDSNDRIVGTGDYKPEIYFFRLEKGEFKVRLQVCHGAMNQIERLKEQSINVYFKNFPPLNFEFSKSIVDVNNNKTLSNGKLNISIRKGEKIAFYITTNVLKVLKQFTVGSYLSGTLSLYKNEVLKKAVTYPFQYIFTSNLVIQNPKGIAASGSKGNVSAVNHFEDVCKRLFSTVPEQVATIEKQNCQVNSSEVEDIPTLSSTCCIDNSLVNLCAQTEFRDGLIKHLLPWIFEMKCESTHTDLMNLILFVNGKSETPEVKFHRLKSLSQNFLKADYGLEERLDEIEALSEVLINQWDTKELADYLGAKYSEATMSLSKDQKMRLDKNKSNLIEVFCIFGTALCERLLLQGCCANDKSRKETSTAVQKRLEQTYCHLCRFVSPWDNNPICLPFFVLHAYISGCFGRLLKLLLKTYENQPSVHAFNLIHKTLARLGWVVFAEHYKSLLPLKYPNSCRKAPTEAP